VRNNWEYDFIGTMRAMWVESGKMPSAKQETLLLELAIKLVLWAETGRPSLRASRSYFDGLIDCYGLNHSDDEPPEDEPPDDDPNRYRTT
jgi:hypothetical protein